MLNISPITLGYQGQAVLEFNGLELPKGGQCLITGPSGSGKTTMLYAIAGLVRVITGKIVIGKTDITKLSEAELDHFRGKKIGMIFQTLHLMKSLSVLDNLLLAPFVADLPQQRERALALLTELGIADKANALPGALSQGQAQRVAIARAVLNQPALLLADEPTSSLDDEACANVVGLIRQAARETGATLVISTHDQRVKEHFDHIIQLGGRP